VFKDQAFPADLFILNSSETQGLCYIETANLDGETNLKLYQALPETTHLESPSDLVSFDAFITAEPPNTRLYTFYGTLTMNNQVLSLSAKQVLLRGCMLKNTDWMYLTFPTSTCIISLIRLDME
jgi:phospholipid-transporting ATPase